MDNSGLILTLAYPETIVMVSKEWYSPFLRFVGIGKKNYLRAGHAALVLINKETGVLEYHDFGRYITPEPFGRVRGKHTDNELHFPIKAIIKNNEILNLDEILKFLAVHPKFTHGEGKLVASVCRAIDYEKGRAYITEMQNMHFIRYAAFKKNATNCARFVTDALIAGVTDKTIRKNLMKSKWFTPSTIGNVLLANTEGKVFEVSESGEIFQFKNSKMRENMRCFLDKLEHHEPNFLGSLHPKKVENLHEKAQWLPGIAAGAWFELHYLGDDLKYHFRRISPHGNIDVSEVYMVNDTSFEYHFEYQFVHYSNCQFFHIKQGDRIYRFDRVSPLVN
ncbi:DUF6695 family protein [Gaetbulibacter saemankumensis]|uniref:DUF6695 family protein n=1 Tax=Gaetbulibacter saemankumensis TaxID=311208 RepID=UPI00040B40D7|nr:DUF6695 family protein [Gaetbulibacter saemankumensis]